jgi:class 3 adenylate cyclase
VKNKGSNQQKKGIPQKSSATLNPKPFLVSALGAAAATDDCAIAGKYAGWFPALSYEIVDTCLRALGVIVDPEDDDDSGNSDISIWIILVPASVFVAILSLVLGLWLRMYLSRKRQEREAERFAPKEGQMLIVFTDIESSSKLWEVLPMNIMHDAVQRHNAILRKLLIKHSGYEVKTQGDSFFVVFSNPSDGIRWSCDVQKELVTEPWHPGLIEAVEKVIDEAKDRSHEEEKVDKDEKTVSFGRSTIIDEDERKNPPVWNGLRVRIGGCVGEPTCVKDPSTRRFDYYGPDVNRAARIGDMAYGGQIVFSERVEPYLDDTISNGNRNGKTPEADEFVIHPQGIFNLKGVNSEEPVIQVMPSSLSGRKFPSLVSRKSSLSGAALFTALPNTVMKKLKYFSVGMYLIWDEFDILPPWLSLSGRSVDMDPTLDLLREGKTITLDLFKVSKGMLTDVASSRSGENSTGRSLTGLSTGRSSWTSQSKYKESQVLPFEDV